MTPGQMAVGLASLAALVLTGLSEASAGGASFTSSGGVRAQKALRSWQEIRQARVVRQQWDLSCGSAALSTILTYHYADPVPEAGIVASILHRTDPVKIRARGGFSLLDLKRFVEGRGYQGKGYADLSLEDLTGLGAPAIVPVRLKGFDHFVVFRGLVGDRVVLADPAYGNLTMRAGRFLEIWKDGIGFVVLRPESVSSPDGLTPRPEDLGIPDALSVGRVLGGGGPAPFTRRAP